MIKKSTSTTLYVKWNEDLTVNIVICIDFIHVENVYGIEDCQCFILLATCKSFIFVLQCYLLLATVQLKSGMLMKEHVWLHYVPTG